MSQDAWHFEWTLLADLWGMFILYKLAINKLILREDESLVQGCSTDKWRIWNAKSWYLLSKILTLCSFGYSFDSHFLSHTWPRGRGNDFKYLEAIHENITVFCEYFISDTALSIRYILFHLRLKHYIIRKILSHFKDDKINAQKLEVTFLNFQTT